MANEDDDFPATAVFFLVIGPLAIIVQLGSILYQLLRQGHTSLISVLDLFRWGGSSWALAPQDWIGLHHFLASFPLGLGVCLVCLLVSWIALRVTE